MKIIFLSYFRYNALDWAARAHNIDCNYGGYSNKFVVDVCIAERKDNDVNILWLDRNIDKSWKFPFKYTWNLTNNSKDEKEENDNDSYLKLTTKNDVLGLMKEQYKIAFNYSSTKYQHPLYDLDQDKLRLVLKRASEGILYIYYDYIKTKINK